MNFNLLALHRVLILAELDGSLSLVQLVQNKLDRLDVGLASLFRLVWTSHSKLTDGFVQEKTAVSAMESFSVMHSSYRLARPSLLHC